MTLDNNKGNSPSLVGGFLAAIFVVAVWGETFVSSKVLLSYGLTPIGIFTIRFFLAYTLIWIVSPKKIRSRSIRDEVRLALLGISGGTLYFVAENNALIYSTASSVAILVSTAPLLTALLISIVHKDERPTGVQVGASFLSFVGVALVVLNGKFILHINPLGDSLALASALLWAIYSLIYREIEDKYDVWFITRKIFFWGLVSIIPYFIFNQHPVDPSIFREPAVWGNLLYLGIVASLLCFAMWNFSLRVLGTVRTTNLIYAQPFFTMLFAFIILGEKVSWMALAGAVLIVGGMIIYERAERRKSSRQA